MERSHNTPVAMKTRHDEQAAQKLHALIDKVRLAMLGTYDALGSAHSRPMMTLGHDRTGARKHALWFLTDARSRKITELQRDDRVLIDYVDPIHERFVSLVDSAEYWDTASSALVHAYGYVKARLTGEPPKTGDVTRMET